MPRVDRLADCLLAPAHDDFLDLLHNLNPDDFTACEFIAMVTILRSVMERKQAEEMTPRIARARRSISTTNMVKPSQNRSSSPRRLELVRSGRSLPH